MKRLVIIVFATLFCTIGFSSDFAGLWKVTMNVFDGTTEQDDNLIIQVINDTVEIIQFDKTIATGKIVGDTIFTDGYNEQGIDWIRKVTKDSLISSPTNSKHTDNVSFNRIDLTGTWEEQDYHWEGEIFRDTCHIVQMYDSVYFYYDNECTAKASIKTDSLVVIKGFTGLGVNFFDILSNEKFSTVPMVESIDKVEFVKLSETLSTGTNCDSSVLDVDVEFSNPFAPITAFYLNKTCVESGDLMSYSWNFGDGYSVFQTNPIVTYTEPGTYYYWLKAINNDNADNVLYDYIVVRDTAQRGEFEFDIKSCNDDSSSSPCSLDQYYEIIGDSIHIYGCYYGNCGTTKTATVRYSADTAKIKIWETGPKLRCNCNFCFDIYVPYKNDPGIVLFNGERIYKSDNTYIINNTTTIATLLVDYATYNFDGGVISYYSCPNCTDDSIPFTIDYNPPGDFGDITFTLSSLQDTVFDATIIWTGLGQIYSPINFTTDTPFTDTTIATNKPSDFRYINEEGQTITDDYLLNKADSAWDVIDSLKITNLFAEKGFKAAIYLYPPTVGSFDPSVAKWVVFLYHNDQITGINLDEKTNSNLKSFPNPANDFINIVTEDNLIHRIKIYSLTGRVLTNQNLSNQSSAIIDISDLDVGIYILEIELNNKEILKQKIIKKR